MFENVYKQTWNNANEKNLNIHENGIQLTTVPLNVNLDTWIHMLCMGKNARYRDWLIKIYEGEPQYKTR